jgi:hypothetical protein
VLEQVEVKKEKNCQGEEDGKIAKRKDFENSKQPNQVGKKSQADDFGKNPTPIIKFTK